MYERSFRELIQKDGTAQGNTCYPHAAVNVRRAKKELFMQKEFSSKGASFHRLLSNQMLAL
jgi:hypothetical protein